MAALTSIALGITAATSVGSAVSQRRGAREARRANRADQRRADIANARERRAIVRSARVARAQVEAQGAVSGLTGSSAVAGSTANIQSQLGENLSFLDQNQQLSAAASRANAAAASWMSRAGTFGVLGQLAEAGGAQFGGNPGGGSAVKPVKSTKVGYKK